MCVDNYYGTIKLPFSAIHRILQVQAEAREITSLPIVSEVVHDLGCWAMQGLRVEPLFQYSLQNTLTETGRALETADTNKDNDDDIINGEDVIFEDGAGQEVPIVDDDNDCDEEFDCIDVLGGVSAITDWDLFVLKGKLEDTVNILDGEYFSQFSILLLRS